MVIPIIGRTIAVKIWITGRKSDLKKLRKRAPAAEKVKSLGIPRKKDKRKN